MLHPAQYRVRSEIGRDIRGRHSLDITGVGGEPIVAPGAEVPIVENLPAAQIHLHQRPIDRLQMDVAADGSDLNVAVANIGQRDWSAHRPRVYMTVPDVAHIHHRIRAFQGQIALQAFHRQRTGRRTESERSVRRDQQFIVDLARLLVRAPQQMRRDFNPVAILLLVDFHVTRFERGRHHHLIAAPRLYRNRPVLRIHGNIGVGADRVTVFLLGLGKGCRRQTGRQNQGYDRGVLKISLLNVHQVNARLLNARLMKPRHKKRRPCGREHRPPFRY